MSVRVCVYMCVVSLYLCVQLLQHFPLTPLVSHSVTLDARAHEHTHIHFTAVGDPSEGFRFRDLRHQEDVVFFWSVYSPVKNFACCSRVFTRGSYCVLLRAATEAATDQSLRATLECSLAG